MAASHPFTNLPSATQDSLALNADERAAMRRFLQRLVQTPSHSTEEGQVAALIIEELSRLGIANVHTDGIGNVIARIGPANGQSLLYNAHMDTVNPASTGWPYDPYEGVIVDNVLYGLGACDMKGALAAMVYAASRLAATETLLNGQLVLAFVVQEEPCEGCALKALFEQEDLQPTWVLLGEPSNLQIMRGHRGRVLFKVTVQGKSAHASSPEVGENAITTAARLLFGIDLLAADLPRDPFLGQGTLAVTHIDSHAPSFNAIPDSCTFYIDRRLTLGETPTRARAQIESVALREGIDARIEVVQYHSQTYSGYELDVREAFNAWALDGEHPLIQVLGAASRTALGHMPEIGYWPFSTDGVFTMGEAGIPTAGFGPGDPLHAHTVVDQVHLGDVAKAAQTYALLAAMTLGPRE